MTANDPSPTLVVKRHGHRASEIFSRSKLHASVVLACKSIRTPDGQADITATQVVEAVVTWCQDHREITSADIRHQAGIVLERLHDEAGYIYQNHTLIV